MSRLVNFGYQGGNGGGFGGVGGGIDKKRKSMTKIFFQIKLNKPLKSCKNNIS